VTTVSQDLFTEILGMQDSDWPRLDRSYFDSERIGHGGFSARFYQRLGLSDGAPIPESLRATIARGLQRAVEQAVMRMAGSGRTLCLAGGLAHNALLIAALEQSGRWENVFVQPAAGNAGTALGAAFYAWHNVYGHETRIGIGNLCLGPEYDAEQIKQVLENCKLRFRYLLTTEELIETAVRELGENKIIAWMHGRMEFGPRALGNRSILASPLDPYSTENLNIYIKRREPFRKFAASVPAELASEYFEVGPNARFLATVGRVRPAHRRRSRAPCSTRTASGCTRFTSGTIPSTGACFTLRAKPPACRSSTTLRSTSSATRWSARRATRSAAFTPPA
jgi:carbamoyltransferase